MIAPSRFAGLRLFLREAWQNFRAAFLCRHRRLIVLHGRGMILCHRCAMVWSVEDRGTFAERWISRRLTRSGVAAIVARLDRK